MQVITVSAPGKAQEEKLNNTSCVSGSSTGSGLPILPTPSPPLPRPNLFSSTCFARLRLFFFIVNPITSLLFWKGFTSFLSNSKVSPGSLLSNFTYPPSLRLAIWRVWGNGMCRTDGHAGSESRLQEALCILTRFLVHLPLTWEIHTWSSPAGPRMLTDTWRRIT